MAGYYSFAEGIGVLFEMRLSVAVQTYRLSAGSGLVKLIGVVPEAVNSSRLDFPARHYPPPE